MIAFTWKIPQKPIYNAALAIPYLAKNRINVFNKILPIIQSGIVIKTPVGATSRLRNSILTKVEGDTGSVFTDLEYAVAVNDGRRAAPVAASADPSLSKWIRLSKRGQQFFAALKQKNPNITVEGAIFLLKRGKKAKATPGQNFFEKGIESVNSIVNNTLNNVLKLYAGGIA